MKVYMGCEGAATNFSRDCARHNPTRTTRRARGWPKLLLSRCLHVIQESIVRANTDSMTVKTIRLHHTRALTRATPTLVTRPALTAASAILRQRGSAGSDKMSAQRM